MSAMTGEIIAPTRALTEFSPSRLFLSEVGYISADQKKMSSKPADMENLPIILIVTITQFRSTICNKRG